MCVLFKNSAAREGAIATSFCSASWQKHMVSAVVCNVISSMRSTLESVRLDVLVNSLKQKMHRALRDTTIGRARPTCDAATFDEVY